MGRCLLAVAAAAAVGGPLSEAADGRGTITCSFCGTANEVSAPVPQPIIIKLDAGRQAAALPE